MLDKTPQIASLSELKSLKKYPAKFPHQRLMNPINAIIMDSE
jgi:hypothetical protein